MSDRLKPCMRCGIAPDNVIGENVWDEDGESRIGVRFICECNLSIFGENENDAVRQWNTRLVEDALRARIAELEAFRDGVPWEDIASMCWRIGGTLGHTDVDVVSAWLTANRPPEPDDSDPDYTDDDAKSFNWEYGD